MRRSSVNVRWVTIGRILAAVFASTNLPACGGPQSGGDTGADTSAPEISTSDVSAGDTTDTMVAMDVIDATNDATDDAMDAIESEDASVADVVTTDTPTLVDVAPDRITPTDGGTGTLRFDVPIEWPQMPRGYAIAHDVNNDGRPDALSIDPFNPFGQNQVTFAIAQSDGSFVPATTFTVPGEYLSFEYGDFNNDGHVDLLARLESATLPNSYVLLGNGDGTFGSTETLTFQADYVADFNADGLTDILEAGFFANAVMHLRQGPGAFTTTMLTFTTDVVSIGDFNGDGKPDIASDTTVYLNQGNATFGTGLTATCAGCPEVRYVKVVRMDGNDRDDLVVADNSQLAILLAQPNGSLVLSSTQTVMDTAHLDFGDIDGDSNMDLVVIQQPIAVTSDDLLEVMFGDGAGAITERRSYHNTRWNIAQVDVMDVDHDALLDVVLEGRYIVYGRGNRRLRTPELSTYRAYTDSAQIAALQPPGPLDLVVPTTTADLQTFGFDGNRRLGTMQTCNGPGSGQYRGVEDVTGDGIADLVASTASSLSVWIGMGGCSFGPENVSPITSYWKYFVKVDGDAIPDLVFATTGGLGVSLATAPGVFGPVVVSPTTAYIDWLATGDWNHDGFIDALVVDAEHNGIVVFQGDAGHMFTQGQTLTTTSGDTVYYPTPGDVDGDGDLDVLFANASTSKLEILRNDGAGNFAREELATIDTVAQFSLGDFDNDGRLEVLASDDQLDMAIWRVDATSATASVVLRLAIPRGAFPADVDGDGDLDLVTTDHYDGYGIVTVANNLLINP